ncbi:hypothetical protein P0F65_07065 [Sphingomonas sp. I4]
MVAAEIRRLRHADLPNPPDWKDTTPIGDQGLGLDSLERLSALGGLAEVFGLDDATLPDRPARYVGDWVDWVIQGHPPGGSRITIKTSGSTGPSVSCTHPCRTLPTKQDISRSDWPTAVVSSPWSPHIISMDSSGPRCCPMP